MTSPRLPSLDVPDIANLVDHAGTVVLAALALVMIGFSQTAGDARAFAAKHRYQVDIDQESVAQAAANIGAGLLKGMPVSTSLSASSLNDRSGARSGIASLTSGATVLLALLVLAPLFSALPKPVLAALIIEAVVMGMMDVAEMRRMRRVSRIDFWVASAALLGTLVFGILAGVVIGIALSLLWLGTSPRIPRCRPWGGSGDAGLWRPPGVPRRRDLPRRRGRADGRRHLLRDGGCPEDRGRTEMLSPDVTGMVLHFAGANFIDSRELPQSPRSSASRRSRTSSWTVERPTGDTDDARTRWSDRQDRSQPGPRQRLPRRGRPPLDA